MKYLISLFLFLCLFLLICEAEGKGKAVKELAKAAAKVGKKSTSRFFSAWTIISLVMVVIIISVLAYYLFMFYPLVCAERGKYDVMEMAHV
ncbi:hypothetical protein GE061_010888 [Apolygus lucorum]|uniref:Uncharacterized protein n=1 Tax=Apolygus lucorum TaxID=248454 RepID=A0A6A4JRJ6_APOLU|nr:hypothetical protein GE061_010888 [Apolygus lucorum]